MPVNKGVIPMGKWDSREARDALYCKALETWGVDDRMAKTAEECSELAAALIRVMAATVGHEVLRELENAVGELVDVMIMCEQMELVFGDAAEQLVALRDAKLDRLAAFLEEEGHA